MKDPLVSIIITCYNYGQYLNEAIESSLKQTYRNIEIIVINDGSTDNSDEVAKSFLPKIEYTYQDNMGIPSTRNLGLEKARGDYLCFLDADDVLEPSYVEKCLETLNDNPKAAYVYTQMRLFGHQTQATNFPDFGLAQLKRANFINASALIRAGAAKQFRFQESFAQGWEDWDYYLTLAENGHTGRLLDLELLNYRKHDTSREDKFKENPKIQKQLMLKLAAAHPKLYSPMDVYSIHLRFWLRRYLPWLIPTIKSVGAMR